MMWIGLISSLVGLGTLLFVSTQPHAVDTAVVESLNPVQLASQTVDVAAIAQKFTVRVISPNTTGSGVLIGRQGSLYRVLTCNHVVATRTIAEANYTVFTSDGRTYSARRLVVPELRSLDLAVLEFESKTNYTLAQLGSLDRIQPGTSVYAVGFPNYRYYPEDNRIESTKTWGMQAFQFTSGQFSMLLDRPLVGGYRFGYSNEVKQGMSGGAVLNAQGLVIGINGRLKYPLQGIDAYQFMDGSRPSSKLSKDLEQFSWAIPVSSFQSVVTQLQQRKLHQS